jgi:TolB-like protein
VKRLFGTFFGRKPQCNAFDSKNPAIPFLDRVQGFFRYLAFCLLVLEGCQGPPDVAVLPDSSSASLVPSDQQRVLDPPYTLAILPFENLSRYAHLDWLRRGLQEMLVSDLAKWPPLEVVSRDALGPVLREQWLQQRGFSSAANSVGLGQLKGVRYLIQGRIYAQLDVLAVDLQVVDVETGVVVGSVKAQGVESEIPRLEQDLVTQAMRLFDPSLNLNTRSTPGEVEEELQRPPNRHVRVEEGRGNALSAREFPSLSVHQIDAFLSLEKLTYQRREAYRLAETIWNEGWSSEIGQPFYHVWQLPDRTTRSVPIMSLPISVFFSPHRLADIFERSWNAGTDTGVRFHSDGFLTMMDEVSGANQLFVEHFHKPRRVFVRAFNEQGDVLAVFSHWAWRTERNIHMLDPQRVSLPMWPKPFITGFAQFPVDWIEREGRHVTFDAVVVPVPDEQVIVMLEPLGESEENTNVVPGQAHQEEVLLQTVEKWIRSHWTPAITEGLPLSGYLPGNKRTAVGVVHIQDGKIVQIQFQNWPDEPLFFRSLNDLTSNLLGSCVECQDSGRDVPSSSRSSKTFRLQLTLVKDIHALQLGSRSR